MQATLEMTRVIRVPAYRWSGKDGDVPNIAQWLRGFVPHARLRVVDEGVATSEPKGDRAYGYPALEIIYTYYDAKVGGDNMERIVAAHGDWVVALSDSVICTMSDPEAEGYKIVA